MFKKSFYVYLAIAAVLGGAFSFLMFKNDTAGGVKPLAPPLIAHIRNPSCTYNIGRLNGYHYIRPLMFAAQECESEKYEPVKTDITNAIEALKTQGTITSASVYLENFNEGEWVSFNGGEKYLPGSLLKVPLLITYLRMDEEKPGLLDEKILYERPFADPLNPVFKSNSIQPGHTYTIKQLLHFLIANSDNNANYLLWQKLNITAFKKTFTDLGLQAPDITAANYPISAKDYSVFMEALYNAAYLTIPHSEYATALLSECDFKDGMANGLPVAIVIAHKFGEAGTNLSPELHESGIIYLGNSPYLLTVMTKGADIKKLPAVISDISKLVYADMEKYN